MKFLLDQDVYVGTIRFLTEQEHDVLPVAHIGLSQADDVELLKKAKELGRIFVTRDSDFGRLVFMENLGAGVLYLRMLPSNHFIATLLGTSWKIFSKILMMKMPLIM